MCKWASRDLRRPMGGGRRRKLHAKERLGNRLLRACCKIAHACDVAGIPWIWEQPVHSLMWRTRLWKSLFAKEGHLQRTAVVDWCRYGRPWKKRTMFCGRLQDLDSLQACCVGGHLHEHLTGWTRDTDGRYRARSDIAGEYSQDFCNALMRLASRSL